MNRSLADLEIKVLEKMYLRETRILKFKLLSGAFKKNVLKQKNKVIEVALAIHLKQFEVLSAQTKFPQYKPDLI